MEAFVGVNMHRIDINDVIANFSGVVIDTPVIVCCGFY